MRGRTAVLAAALIISPFGAQGADPMMWWQRGFFAREDEAIAEVAAAFEQRTGKHVELVQLKQDEMLDQAPADASARHTCVKHARDADLVNRQQRRPQRGYSRSGLAGRPDPMADERFLVKIHIPDKELLRRLRSYDFDVIRQTVREQPEGGYSADAILSMDEVRDWRFRPVRQRRRNDRLPEVPHSSGGSAQRHLPARGPRALRATADALPHQGRSGQQGLAHEAGIPDGCHLRQSCDRDSAARRPHVGTPPRARRVDYVAAEPADGARHRESRVVSPLRPGHRRDPRQLRQDGGAPDPSRIARLARGRVHEQRVEPEAAPSADDDVRGVSDGVGLRSRRQRQEGSRESAAVAVPPAASRCRDDSRQHTGGQRRHRSENRRHADFSRMSPRTS